MRSLAENYLRVKYEIPNDLSVHEVADLLVGIARDGYHTRPNSRIFYRGRNWCSRCELAFPKDVLYCSRCHSKIRIGPRRSSARQKLRRSLGVLAGNVSNETIRKYSEAQSKK